MAQPLNAMDLVQSWNLTQAKQAALAQQMAQEQALLPYRIAEYETNALAKREAIQNQRNALASQERRFMEQNALQREIAQTRANALLNRPRPKQIVQTDSGPMMVDETGQASPILGPGGQPVKPKGLEKALPTSAAQKLMENQQNLRRAEQALTLIEGRNVLDDKGMTVASGDDQAIGKKGFLTYLGDSGNYALNALDPSGVDTRAAIADLGSLIIHDRSGAAVTAAEYPRLRPFIPQATDSPETAKKKLKRFVSEYQNLVGEAADFYKESGYKVPDYVLRSGSGARQSAPSDNDPLGMRR